MKLDLTPLPDRIEKTNLRLATDQTVASLARPIPPLSINSSIPRAIETVRQSNLDRYPVVSGSHLILLLSESDLSSVLLSMSAEDQESYRLRTLADILGSITARSVPTPVVTVSESVSVALSIFRDHPDQSVIGVVDRTGNYYGVLGRGDLLAGCFRTLAPARVGGMATPLGVYLTDGVESGGVGNVALMLAGASMMLLFLLAVSGATLVQNLAVDHHIDIYGKSVRLLMPIMPQYAASFVDDIQMVIPLLLMLVLLRTIPVAGYHAAEHQVVHCIERGEPLLPEKVASMPRPHPRCGTNLVAAVSLFGIYFSIFAGLWTYSAAIVPAGIFTLLTWRQVGTFFQQYFTTRKASSKQLASGIAAGEDLLRKYRQNTNRTVKLPVRIWRMGLLQMITGSLLMGAILWAVSNFVPALRPILQSING